jgi:hypothetical protein
MVEVPANGTVVPPGSPLSDPVTFDQQVFLAAGEYLIDAVVGGSAPTNPDILEIVPASFLVQIEVIP